MDESKHFDKIGFNWSLIEKCETLIFVMICNYKKLPRLLFLNIWKIYIKNILYLIDTF